jgi:nickel/cobalt transporter (NicO) family protein
VKRIFISIVLILGCSQLFAHPMGSFSISHYSRLRLKMDGIEIDYVIDMAEIPSYQEMEKLDSDGDHNVTDAEKFRYAGILGNQFIRYLRLKLNDSPVALQLRKSNLQIRPGAAQLSTLVTTCTYWAPYPAGRLDGTNRIHLADENYPMRSGWREMVVDRNDEFVKLSLSPDEYKDRSRELSQYPKDPTSIMPQEMILDFTFRPLHAGEINVPEVVAQSGQQPGRTSRDDRFTKLIATKELTGKIILISMMIAFLLGSLHALSPGHGKTIVAGYLIGSRGTARHAMFLGAIVTFTHTIGVFALGLITLFGSRYILPERLYPWLGFLSGMAIVLIGGALFIKRFRSYRTRTSASSQEHHHHHHQDDYSHDHPHSHSADGEAHDHHDHHGHTHLPVDRETGNITWKSLLTVGISGGALPCPSALVVLLSAISLHRIGFGLLLIVAFSLGLAIVLTTLGVLLVYASHFTQRFRFGGKLAYGLPLVSSFVITILGCAIAVQSLLQI